jgi:hypothetical protein
MSPARAKTIINNAGRLGLGLLGKKIRAINKGTMVAIYPMVALSNRYPKVESDLV